MDLDDETPPPQKFYGSNWGEIQKRMKSVRLAIDRVTASGIDLELPPIPDAASEFLSTAAIQTFIYPLDDFIYFRNPQDEGADDMGRWSRGTTTRADRASEEEPGDDPGFPTPEIDLVGLPVLLRMRKIEIEDPDTFWVGNGNAEDGSQFFLGQTELFLFVTRFALYLHDLHEWFLDASAIIDGESSSVTGLEEVKEEFDGLKDEWSKVKKWKSHGGKK